MKKPLVLVILGPTASGKSDMAIKIAKQFNGEIISADSRQIYEGLDIGTGKVTEKEMDGIKHHLLDIKDPKEKYSVSEWKKDAEIKIEEILKRNKLPIICGGTGFYIESIVKNLSYPNAPHIKELWDISLEELLKMLPSNIEVDKENKVRVIRKIELLKHYGFVPSVEIKENKYDFIQIGIKLPDEILKGRIYKRLISRIENGMIQEVENLNKNGLSFEKMDEIGLEYRYISKYLKKELTLDELKKVLNEKIWQYARRQKTWFKRDKDIIWVENFEQCLEKLKALPIPHQ